MPASPGKKRNSSDEGLCFLCGAGTFKERYGGIRAEGRVYSIKACDKCGLGRTDPFLDEKALQKLYSSTYRGDDSKRFFSPIEKLIRVLRVQRCRRVERYSRKGPILDVGCGRADFLSLMKERGWKTAGLELDKRIEAHGKRAGMDLRAGSLDNIRFPDSYFDAVTFWHVFEHIRRPVETITECARILKPGGLLVIAVPNIGSVQARLTGGNWFHLDPPYHLYHYSLRNIKDLLASRGFRIAGVKHYSLEYNPYGYIQSVFNSFGFRPNLLYDFLRSKEKGSYLSLALMGLMLPVAVPLSILLSAFEAIIGMGGTIEVYAVKG